MDGPGLIGTLVVWEEDGRLHVQNESMPTFEAVIAVFAKLAESVVLHRDRDYLRQYTSEEEAESGSDPWGDELIEYFAPPPPKGVAAK